MKERQSSQQIELQKAKLVRKNILSIVAGSVGSAATAGAITAALTKSPDLPLLVALGGAAAGALFMKKEVESEIKKR